MIAANRMKINSASLKTSNSTGTNAYYMERQQLVAGTTIIIIISHFFGQISLKLIQVCYFLIERTRIGDGMCLCVLYVGNNWTVGTLNWC